MNKIIAEVTAKGLHIPYSVFAQLGWEIGTKIVIEFHNKTITIRRAESNSAETLKAQVAGD
jgi:antitoxin component of MazEF toxin-antitoxin module